VTDDDFRELEPHISDHPFQPGSWPDACGHVDEHGWTCGYTRAEHTHITGEEATPHEGQGGLDEGGTGRRCRCRLASVSRRGAGRGPLVIPRQVPMVFVDGGVGQCSS
jgi:hypothetical protein